MHRFMLFAAAAALILTGTADAAPRKKPRVTAEQSSARHMRHHHVARPAAVPLNQQWPTSWSDGSFSFRGN